MSEQANLFCRQCYCMECHATTQSPGVQPTPVGVCKPVDPCPQCGSRLAMWSEFQQAQEIEDEADELATVCAARDAYFSERNALAIREAKLFAELSALRAERDALRADAERYRWLRHDDMISDWEAKGIVSLYSGPDYTRLDGQALDNAIDAARAALKVEPK